MVVVVTGVSGSGKTTVGRALATCLGFAFEDADDLHSVANVEKMRHGIPLTDADREPWIRAVERTIADHLTTRRDLVLACSARRRRHRDALRAPGDVRFVLLDGSYELID